MSVSNANQRTNYVTSNRFYVEMESSITASFSECAGLSVKIKQETFSEGGLNDQRRVLLGPAEFTEVTLKRGMTDSLLFWDWMNQIVSGNCYERRNINILVFNQAGETMQCWTLKGAVPVGWKAPSLQADGNAVAIEELTLAYEGLSVTKSSSGVSVTSRDVLGYF
ncbi:phage tail protein [Anthocerotibacter panamensis]|uniref:phage tail protein n=1 Tax=Anthocerotibacter panamensis TaxID=2857077 RepID=UPI001C406110|nr:phage tail protein [Anthocerotibacter panamensis]